MQSEVEVLAPAGSIEAFTAAINAGADAVYMGVDRYNARTMSKNFSIEEYEACILEAHKRAVKVYLTLNTLMKDSEIKDALKIVADLYSVGLDAVILQDLGLALTLHKLFPDLAMHASTQMSVYSKEQVEFLASLGFKRVVLARELSIEEIKEICNSTNVEIEVFVHGALCVSVSGQCNMSRLIGSRSANRGSCAQPCRQKYSLYKRGEASPVIANKYILSKKDIWGLDLVPELIEAGVKSLKIEGRNKFPEYVAEATRLYKKRVTEEVTDMEKRELLQVFNRSGKAYGYLKGVRYKESVSLDTPKNVGLMLGNVLGVRKNFIKVKLQECVNLHDGIEVYSDSVISTIVTCIKDENGNIVNAQMNKGDFVWLGDINGKCKIGDKVFKTTDSQVISRLNSEFVKKLTRKTKCDIDISVKSNSPVTVKAGIANKSIVYESEVVPQKSMNHKLTESEIKEAFQKTQDTFVDFNVTCDLDDDLYLSKAELNCVRREVIEKLENMYAVVLDVSSELDQIENISAKLESGRSKSYTKQDSLYVYKYSTKKDYFDEYKKRYGACLTRLYINASAFLLYEQDIFEKYANHVELFVSIPSVTLKNLNRYILNNLERLVEMGVKGVLVGNLQYTKLLKDLKAKYNIKLVADGGLNITNTFTIKYLKEFGFDTFTLSLELSDEDIKSMIGKENIELTENLASAMTSRYCILGSFVANRENAKNICTRPCTKGKYYIKDAFGKEYDIVCDSVDCIMTLVRNKSRYEEEIENKVSIRHVWL